MPQSPRDICSPFSAAATYRDSGFHRGLRVSCLLTTQVHLQLLEDGVIISLCVRSSSILSRTGMIVGREIGKELLYHALFFIHKTFRVLQFVPLACLLQHDTSPSGKESFEEQLKDGYERLLRSSCRPTIATTAILVKPFARLILTQYH